MAEIQYINYGDVLEHYKAFGTFPTGFSTVNCKKLKNNHFYHSVWKNER